MTETRNFYIETFGCQMNERDSEIMAQLLGQSAYVETSRPEDADCIVINTCSIRGKAAQKAYSLLGGYRKLKERRPSLVIAMAGCVAQQDGESLLKKIPHLDLVIGPQNIYRLPELVDAARQRSVRTAATGLADDFVIPPFLPEMNEGIALKRFVTIMQGCNNFCTYCVVPHTRGREVSRRPEDIIAEVRHLADHGVREVTLLGQNVNSYGRDRQAVGAGGINAGENDRVMDFPGDKRRGKRPGDGFSRSVAGNCGGGGNPAAAFHHFAPQGPVAGVDPLFCRNR